MDQSDPLNSHGPDFTSNWNVSAPAGYAQDIAYPVHPMNIARQFPQEPAPQPFSLGHGHRNYYTPSQAPTGSFQDQSPRYRTEPPSELISKKPVKRKRSSRGAQSSQASRDAAPSRSRATITQKPATGSNGLMFRSCAEALSITDKMFRAPLKRIVDDDVEEIERDKSSSVLKIINALKHTEFMPPPETKINRKRVQTNLTDEEKEDWLEWQNDANESVKVKSRQRNSGAKREYYAWEIIEEMVKIHRMGYRFAKQSKDVKSKCSERIDTAVRVIKDYAIVRKKLLKGDKITNFCTGPDSYARITISSLWNNSYRKRQREAMQVSGGDSTRAPKGRRKIPVDDGATALDFELRSTVTARKRAAKAVENTDAVEDEGKGGNVGEDTAIEGFRSNPDASPYGEEGGEEGDEDEEEDKDDEDADQYDEEDDDYDNDDDHDDNNDEEDQGEVGYYEAQENTEGQRGSARMGMTPGFANVHTGTLPQGFLAVVPQFGYSNTYFHVSQHPAHLGNARTQASPFEHSTYSSSPAMAWAMEPELPGTYKPTTAVSSVVSATTPFDLELINPPFGMYSAQARTGGCEPSYGHRAGFTDQPAPTVPSNSFSDPCDPFDTGSAPPSVKRRRI